jgi:serine/threonine protein kinase
MLGWVHNDIKLENILIGYKDPSRIYLIDFGLSQ